MTYDSGAVLWVTNLAAPYRIPVWSALAQKFRLTVGLLESSERLARDAGQNRGRDWAASAVPGVAVHEYKSVRIKRGEDRHYGLLSARVAADLARADTVLLGGWDSPAYFQLLLQAKAMRKGTVGFHESHLGSQSRSDGLVDVVRKYYFQQLDRIVVPGPAARDAVLAMGVPPERILTGFNAVDVAMFRDSPKPSPHLGHRFLYVGQLIERKNLQVILEAFSSMAAPEDHFTVIGRGELREQLECLAQERGIWSRVTFIDYVDNSELPGLMAQADTLVLASHVEVWGLVVNEALATGMQAVITENCGVAPSVAGMPGVYLAARDASDLADVMRRARDSFSGRIPSPPILNHTPEAFADVFSQAFEQAIAVRRAKRSPV